MAAIEFVEIGTGSIILKCRRYQIGKKSKRANIYQNPEEVKFYLINSIENIDLSHVRIDKTALVFNYETYLNDKTKMMENQNDCFITFSMDKVIRELLQSYSSNKSIICLDDHTKKNIHGQLTFDFPRFKILFNSSKCNSIESFHYQIKKYEYYKHDTMSTIYELILMLCTQASFYYPFNIINNLYELAESSLHIVSTDEIPSINIVECEQSVNIILKKTLKYTNIDSCKIMTKIHTFMIMTIDLSDPAREHGLFYFVDENSLLIKIEKILTY
jgi:hypothetical protein